MIEAICSAPKRGALPAELSKLAAGGFFEQNGIHFLSCLEPLARSAVLSDFVDRTGYECFVNSIHVDDYVSDDFLGCAIDFADQLFVAWRNSGVDAVLNVIVSCDETGAVVRCHSSRKGERWLAANLDGYDEAVLVVDSSFAGFLSGGVGVLVDFLRCICGRTRSQ